MVLAPGLGSTSTCWPRRVVRPSAITRTRASIAPPGLNGTTMRIGLVGQALSARAANGAASAAARKVRLPVVLSAAKDLMAPDPRRALDHSTRLLRLEILRFAQDDRGLNISEDVAFLLGARMRPRSIDRGADELGVLPQCTCRVAVLAGLPRLAP